MWVLSSRVPPPDSPRHSSESCILNLLSAKCPGYEATRHHLHFSLSEEFGGMTWVCYS